MSEQDLLNPPREVLWEAYRPGVIGKKPLNKLDISKQAWFKAKALCSLGSASKDGNWAIGNVYLESGNGPGARANPAILAVLIMALQELQLPWMVAGDWNCSPQELQSTTFMRAVRRRVIAPSEATTSQGSDIDSAVTRVELQAYVSVEVEWDVLFKPHGALRYRVQKESATFAFAAIWSRPHDASRPTCGKATMWKSGSVV